MFKVKNFLKKAIVPMVFTLSLFSIVDAAPPTTLDQAKTVTINMITAIEGIATALFMAGFGFKAKWHWSLKNVAESGTDIEKHNKGFQRSIIGLIGLLVMGVVIMFVTNSYK